VIFLKNGQIIACDSPGALTASLRDLEIGLTILSGAENLRRLLQRQQIKACLSGSRCTFPLRHEDLYKLLHEIITAGVVFGDLQIKQPTLENYFLQVAGG
jgi:ABC-type multidrug transport system ATPase subunit